MKRIWLYLAFFSAIMTAIDHELIMGRQMGEICDNGIDDDADGLIDINDDDCICEDVSLISLIPNPSFEEYSCCPEDQGELSCAIGWDQASSGTTHYFHTCGYLVTKDMLPFPDGNGAVLFLDGSVDNSNGNGLEVYKEYLGTCLNRPMQKDSTYIIKFHLGFLNEESSPRINFSFFGSPSCDRLPFTTNVDCPIGYPEWHLLESELVSGGAESPEWVEVTVTITPEIDINALVLGGDCSSNAEEGLYAYLLDNLRLNDERAFDFELIDPSSPCDEEFVFALAENADFSYQWYKEGVALIGESNAALSQMYGEGSYQVRIIDKLTQECRIADDFEFSIPVFETEIDEFICDGETLYYHGQEIQEEGVYDFILSSTEGCDSFVTLNVISQLPSTETLNIRMLPGAVFNVGSTQFADEGEHEIDLLGANGCDSLLLLFIEHIEIYIPNAFSPNGDGINDHFEVFTSDEDDVIKEMSIFDRFGDLLYVGDQWNGMSHDKFSESGVYVYLIKITDNTGEESTFHGSFVLLK